MRQLKTTKAFEKDFVLMVKRGKDMSKLVEVIELLIKGEKLPPKYKDHPLKGNKKGLRDLHIEPDWLLLYRIEDDFIILEATGTHSDLFD